ncbi:glycosyltransferase [Candidatus Pelagibacter sp.]|nr:glycosyltransferase [Candidatus Pelagibacter sp.]
MKKNILIFIPSIEDGGVEKNLFEISNYLNNNKFSLEILTCNNNMSSKFSKDIKFIGTKSTFWQNKNKLLKYIICLFLLFFNLVNIKKKTLVFAFQANIYAIIISKILKTKVITRSNSAPSGWSQNFIKNSIYKFIIRLADGVIVNSIEFQKSIKKKFNRKTVCIYNPFSKKLIEDKLKEKKKIKFFKNNYLNVIAVGRLTDQKDHLTLLKSIKLLKTDFKIKLVIIGKGNTRRLLNSFISNNNLKDKVKLLGYTNNPFPYIQKSNIVILTSKFEGLPNILLEAQYLKKYIISTNCPTGPKEILLNGRAGDLIKVGDYKKLSLLISQYDIKKKSINNKINIGSKYFFRFDHKLNCKKYLDFVCRNYY